MKLDANGVYYRDLNDKIANSDDKDIVIDNVCGQRYIGCGLNGYKITVNGTPGNALAAYMDGSTIVVNGNAQDAT
ncbi:MAG TPA: glutamate synthase, partial [Ruminiclostridium sp.]|nr:glutamate synthase [Ruminiclostridium sp.]